MKVKELLDAPEKWTKKHLFLDRDGTIYGYPVCWCLLGAVSKCYGCEGAAVICRVQDAIGTSLPHWNDAPERTFEDVKQLVNELDI